MEKTPWRGDVNMWKMKSKKDSRLYMVLSMTIFGTIGAFVRGISLSSGELALFRALMALVLIGGYLLIRGGKISLKLSKRDVILLLLSGGAMGINWILLFEAYKHTTVSVATLSYYFAPVIVTVVCPLIFKEKLKASQVICFVISTLGLVLLLGARAIGGDDTTGVLFGLGAATFYASVMLLNKFIKGVSDLHRTFLQILAAAVVLLPYVMISGGVNLGGLNGGGIICLITVGVIHTGVAYCLYFSAIKDLPGQKVALLSYIDPLVAVITSVILLGEKMTVWQVLGGAMILGATLFSELSSAKAKEGANDQK